MHLLTLTTHLVENIYFKNKKSEENGYISQCAKYQMLQQTLFTIINNACFTVKTLNFNE